MVSTPVTAPRADGANFTPIVQFAWDPAKAVANLEKHEVSFHEAATVLEDPLSNTFPDPLHSAREPRFLTVGLSRNARLLVVVHTEEGDTIRIISARRATPREREFYEQG